MPGNEIRALAKVFLPKWVERGYSAARVTKELINIYGKAYRRTQLLEDLREAKGVVLHQVPLDRLRMTTPIPRSYLVETILRRPRRYLVAAMGHFRDEATGELVSRNISWYTQLSGSKQDLFEEYRNAQVEESSAPGETLLRVDFISIRHHREMDY